MKVIFFFFLFKGCMGYSFQNEKFDYVIIDLIKQIYLE